MLAGLKAQPSEKNKMNPKRSTRRYTVIEMVAQDGRVPGHAYPLLQISKSQLIAEQPLTKYDGTYQKKKKKKKGTLHPKTKRISQ